MRRTSLLHCVKLLISFAVFFCMPLSGQQPASNLFAAKTAYLDVKSYKSSNVPSRDLELVRRRASDALESFRRYELVLRADNADLVIEAAFAPDHVYGIYRSQSAPTVFLRIHDRATGAVLYCGSGHSGFLTSATKNAFRDLRKKIETRDVSLDRPSSLCSSAEYQFN